MRVILLTIALLAHLAVNAQSLQSSLKKVAIISLIGDQLSVEVFRERTGTSLDTNAREIVPVQNPVFDHTVLFAVADVGAKLMPLVSFLPLAVPKAESLMDPNLLMLDKAGPINSDIALALQKQGFDHLIAITKYRSAAQMRFSHGNVGSGHLQGLGFYVDNRLRTRQGTTGSYVPGFIAPYAYLKLTLVDLHTGLPIAQETVTASRPRSATQNADATGAWDAMSPNEKTDILRDLIQSGAAQVMPFLLKGK